MNVLVIGGSGHVSGAVARAAVTRGDQVWAVTRGQRPLPAGVRGLTVDRHDDVAMAAAIRAEQTNWDLVVDCIAYDVPDVRQDIALFRDRAAQFVLVSTDFVYDPSHRRFPQPEETEYYLTDDSYGAKKRRCELVLHDSDTGDMAWTIVRPCHIYGPTSELGCLPLHGRNPHLIDLLRAGTPLQLIGGGHFLQQPILADDLAQTILSIAGNAQARHAIFNTAGPDIIESREYYRIIAEILGVECRIEEVPVQGYLAAHPESLSFFCHRIYDLHRLAHSGLHVPATPITEGLRQHVKGLLARHAAA